MSERLRTVSFKISERLDRAVNELAKRRGSSRSAIMREALEAFSKGGRKPSVTELAGDLVGSIRGPRDLATNPKYMDDFGK
jgi:metal-responsive CopG/Arc/MetJ family transcriptional regulator